MLARSSHSVRRSRSRPRRALLVAARVGSSPRWLPPRARWNAARSEHPSPSACARASLDRLPRSSVRRASCLECWLACAAVGCLRVARRTSQACTATFASFILAESSSCVVCVAITRASELSAPARADVSPAAVPLGVVVAGSAACAVSHLLTTLPRCTCAGLPSHSHPRETLLPVGANQRWLAPCFLFFIPYNR